MAEMLSETLQAENRRLRQRMEALAAIMAMPAAWNGLQTRSISESLLDTLSGMLDLDVAHLHLDDTAEGAPATLSVIAPAIAPLLPADRLSALLAACAGGPQRLAVAEGQDLAAVSLPLGPMGEMGRLVVASARAGFPDEAEALVLQAAASQATISLLAARQRHLQRPAVQERDFQLIVDSIPVPVAVTTPTGEVEGANRPTLEYFGRSFEELKSWKASDVVHPDDLDDTIAAQRAAHEAGQTYNVRSRHRRFDGVYRWFNVLGVPLRDADGQILRWLHLIIDIDDQMRAEEALAASGRDLAQIVDMIPGLAWSARIDGFAEFFNQHYVDYVGFPAEEAQGTGWARAVHPEDLPGLLAIWQEMLGNGQAGEAEARLRRFDGEYRWFLFRTNPLRDEAGRVVKWFGVNLDIEDRRQAEEAVHTSESKLRQLTETIPQMLWSATPDGAIDYCNARLLDYTGFRAEEVMGGGWVGLLHEGDVESAKQAWLTSITTGAPFQVEVRTIHAADGTYRWVLTNALPLRDDDGAILRWYGTCIDIHDRKEAEAAIAESERNLAEIIDSIPAYVWSARPDGGIAYLNRHYLDYLGMRQEEVEGRSWLKVVHPDDLQAHIAYRNACLASGQGGEAQTRLRRFDGQYRWFLNRANPLKPGASSTKWFGVTIDIEEVKRTEEQLRASEWNLRRLTETIPQMLWSATPEGECDYCNARLLDFTGLAAAEILGVGWRNLFHPEDVDQALQAWSVSAATGTLYQVEARLRHAADATYRWCLTTALPLRDEEGRILKWHGTCVDMHDWKQAQDELRKTQAELAHVTRVMTMGQLTASIAHELNQPLAGIMTNAGVALRMLTADPPNLEGARETARRTIRDATRASEVIIRLRALFARRTTASECVDLNTAAQEVIALSLNELQRNGISPRIHLAQELPFVPGDRIQLQQVILNFILNGAEAMTGLTDRPKELIISTGIERNGHVRLSVRDVGTGFDPAMAEKLFRPFFSTKSEGMGIGLSVSRTIVENHHGRLWAEAHDGPGATFCFSLPPRSGETAERP